MSRVPSVFLSLMSFVVFSCCASAAAADPLRVTSGVVDTAFETVGQPLNAESLQLMGDGFSIASSLEDERAFIRLTTRPTVAPGALVDVSGILRVEDAIGALLNDSFAVIMAPFEMSFDASPTPLACSAAGSLMQCSGTARFTFDAELTFTPLGGIAVTHRLIGGGTAEATLFRDGSFESGAVRYIFEPTAVPEPATLSLFATSAIVAGAGVWRRRRAGRSS